MIEKFSEARLKYGDEKARDLYATLLRKLADSIEKDGLPYLFEATYKEEYPFVYLQADFSYPWGG